MTDWEKVYPLPWQVIIYDNGTCMKVEAENGELILDNGEVSDFEKAMFQAICDAMNLLHQQPTMMPMMPMLGVAKEVYTREQHRFELFGRVLQGYVANADTDASLLDETMVACLRIANAALEAFEQGENGGKD